MEFEQLNKWVLPALFSGRYKLQNFTDSPDQLSLVFSPISKNKNNILITFEGATLSYQLTASIFKEKVLSDLSQVYQNQEDEFWSFFKMTNSDYAKKLSLASAETYMAEEFTHFVLITENYVIEILDWRSQEDPLIVIANDHANYWDI